MRGRTALVAGDRVVDAEQASGGSVPADPAAVFTAWSALLSVAARLDQEGPGDAPVLDYGALERPVPVPVQAFGVGLNYADHAGESAMTLPDHPLVFPKFSSSIVGPNEPVATRSAALDWEAECRRDRHRLLRSRRRGRAVGDCRLHRRPGPERPGGAVRGRREPAVRAGGVRAGVRPDRPVGVVSADELGATPQLDIRCDVDGVTKQSSNTSHLIFDVPTLVAYLSHRVRLCAGDLIFTGTPAGVGWSREPKELLHPGSRIDTTIGGIGTLTTRVVGR